MLNWTHSIVDSTVQCWGCGVFDRLFRVISAAAATMYDNMVWLGILILSVFIAFYVLYAVVDNLIINQGKESLYDKYIKPVLFSSVVVVSLLGMGVFFPRMVTTFTLEPVANMTLIYSHAMLQTSPEIVADKISYTPEPMADDGFYRPQLRDTIIELMKTSTVQFQSMIKLGLAVMDGAFSWQAIFGIGALVKHVMMFFLGLALVWGFFKLFIKFCFYFVDVIVALTFFAFFFPLGLVFFVFKNSAAAGWVRDIGKNIAPGMLKNAINSIVTLATVVITYVVIMVLIAKFFAFGGDVGGVELMRQIHSGEIYSSNISDDNLATLTLAGIIVLMYVVQFLAGQIKDISKMVTDTFGLPAPSAPLGEALGDDFMKLSGNLWEMTKKTGGIIYSAATGKEPPKETKKEDKK
ncbi:MAG: hypothetical protein FWE52_02755 [Alphaproteobacteria bacterium]|nr:hypothetical protein [Alphaproteobacteria bacterium]